MKIIASNAEMHDDNKLCLILLLAAPRRLNLAPAASRTARDPLKTLKIHFHEDIGDIVMLSTDWAYIFILWHI